MNSTGFNIGVMPKSVTCYICGRGYGTKSISIHLKNCENKWEIEQSKKPKKERRPCPQAPRNFMDVISKDNITHKELEVLNTKAFEGYNEVALEKCVNCSRTFNSESFLIHKKLCSADKPFKPLKNKAEREENLAQIRHTEIKTQPIKPFISRSNVSKPTVHSKPLELTSNYVYNPLAGNNVKPSTGGNMAKPQPTKNVEPDFNDDFEDNYDNQDEDADDLGTGDLAPCAKCGRNFAVDRLSKHQKVCKVNSKPKKVKLFHKPQTNENKKPKDAKWKQQHEALVASMQYMRKVKQVEQQGGDVRKITPPPAMNVANDYQQCPHCSRKFSDNAFERHSKVCMNIVNKPTPLMRKDVNYGGAKTIGQNSKTGVGQRVRY